MQSMYDQVVACIKKPPKRRTEREVESLYPWLSNKAQLFSELKPEVVKDIIRNCDFSETKRDDVIIRQGDTGDCFYVMLCGRVSIFINTEAVPDDPATATVIDDDEGPASKEKVELDRSKYGNYIVSFDSGKSFGELALINKDCVRNASIIADELTHLLVVNRELYNRCLRAAQEAEFKQRMDYVNQCNIFKNWAMRYKRQAAFSLRKETLHFNMHIVRQGEPLNGLSFILKGQAKVTVDALMHYTQYPELRLYEDPEEIDKKETYGEIADQAVDNKVEHKGKLWEKPIRRQGYVVAEQRQAQRHIEVSLVETGEIVGDIEQGMELGTYAQSVICVQDTDIYVIDAKNFERLVKRNPRTQQILKRKAEIKLMSRESRSLDRQIPLIRTLLHQLGEEHRMEEMKQNQVEEQSPASKAEAAGADTSSFIPQRGPLIDIYGPGTVFYRNRMMRLAKLQTLKAKAKAHGMSSNFGSGRSAMAIAMLGLSARVVEDDDDDDEDDRRITVAQSAPLRRKGHVDWETSSEHLGNLEDRLKEWQTVVNELEKRKGSEPVKLKRFDKENANTPRILPGKKVLLRPKKLTKSEEFMRGRIEEQYSDRQPPKDSLSLGNEGKTARDLGNDGKTARDLGNEGKTARELGNEGKTARDLGNEGKTARELGNEGKTARDLGNEGKTAREIFMTETRLQQTQIDNSGLRNGEVKPESVLPVLNGEISSKVSPSVYRPGVQSSQTTTQEERTRNGGVHVSTLDMTPSLPLISLTKPKRKRHSARGVRPRPLFRPSSARSLLTNPDTPGSRSRLNARQRANERKQKMEDPLAFSKTLLAQAKAVTVGKSSGERLPHIQMQNEFRVTEVPRVCVRFHARHADASQTPSF